MKIFLNLVKFVFQILNLTNIKCGKIETKNDLSTPKVYLFVHNLSIFQSKYSYFYLCINYDRFPKFYNHSDEFKKHISNKIDKIFNKILFFKDRHIIEDFNKPQDYKNFVNYMYVSFCVLKDECFTKDKIEKNFQKIFKLSEKSLDHSFSLPYKYIESRIDYNMPTLNISEISKSEIPKGSVFLSHDSNEEYKKSEEIFFSKIYEVLYDMKNIFQNLKLNIIENHFYEIFIKPNIKNITKVSQ